MVNIWHWHTEPLLIGSILFSCWLYYSLIGPWRHWVAEEEVAYPVRKAVLFAVATLVLYLTTGSPLDFIGEAFLFWVHMIQHLLLMYICPVLYMLSIPSWLIDGLLRRYPVFDRFVKHAVHPIVAGTLFTLLFSIWHVPALYEAALTNKLIHILEHFTIFLPSLLMWWSLISPSNRRPSLHPAMQMLYLFLLMVAQTPVFAYLVFSEDVLYPTYEYAPQIMEMTALQDQVLGGVVMKIGNVLLFLVIFGWAFYRWGSLEEDDSKPRIIPKTQNSLHVFASE